MSFLPLQALFGEEEAAPRSRAPDVNEFGMISVPNDIVTIHFDTPLPCVAAARINVSLDGLPLYVAPWVSVEFRHAPLQQ